MKNESEDIPLSSKRIKRIRAQGYHHCSNQEIAQYAFGNRLAYQLCLLLLATGLIFKNMPLLVFLIIIAFMSVVLPYHPFDYIYNYGVRHMIDRPRLPPRSPQLKFACGLAAVLIGGIVYLFANGLLFWGYVLGGVLFAVALLVSTVDLCIPSMIYNTLFRKHPE